MLEVKDEGIILKKTNFEFENESVLNPTCVQIGDITHMFYRAVKKGNFSSIGYCELKDNQVLRRLEHPVLFPEFEYEKHGIEDPRISQIDGTYYLFYTAYDGESARIAYAESSDLINFEKKGLISPSFSYDEAEDIFRDSGLQERYFLFESYYKEKHGKEVLLWEKDAFLLPKKIGNQFALFHRILPGIQIIYFSDFKELTDDYWRDYLKKLGSHIVLDPRNWFEIRNIGGGCPPIETPEGWLLLYHAVEDTSSGKVYHAAAALLDLKNPQKVIGRLPYPLFSPDAPWEKNGVVSNVVFPTGAIVQNGRVTVYYGAADQVIAAKSFDLNELLVEIRKNNI